MISVNSVCEILAKLWAVAEINNENSSHFYLRGYYSDEVNQHLITLADTIIENNLHSHFLLNIDDEEVLFEELDDAFAQQWAEFQLTFKKKDFIQELYSGAGDIDEVLYCSESAFCADLGGLGLTDPLLDSVINNSSNTRIHVYQMNSCFGGPKLAIVPTESTKSLGKDWLSGSVLPQTDKILKHVHLINSEPLKLNPQQFELTWGDVTCELAKPFRNALAKHLFLALSTNYYSDEKVELRGVKHLETKINCDGLDIGFDTIASLSQCITWCYEKEDPDIPLQLVIDRLSLECGSGNLMDVTNKTIVFALEQAKSNYKFVIAKRSDDYRKELKEIYKDIQSVTDKFAEKAFTLASELLKSLLTIGFIFTVGTVSKAVVNQGLLSSPEGQILFKIAGVFLFVSFFVRWLNASADLKVSESGLFSWSNKLHNHIATEEVKSLINSQINWSKTFYLISLAVTGVLQISIAYLVYNSETSLMLLGL